MQTCSQPVLANTHAGAYSSKKLQMGYFDLGVDVMKYEIWVTLLSSYYVHKFRCPLHLATHPPTQHDNDDTPSAFHGVKIIRTLTGVVQKTVTVIPIIITIWGYHWQKWLGVTSRWLGVTSANLSPLLIWLRTGSIYCIFIVGAFWIILINWFCVC